MEAGPKSPVDLEMSGELNGLLTEQDDTVLELSPEIPIKEEEVDEFMQELYRDLHSGALIDTTSFLAGNVKSETCGASVSDSALTVMAGITFAGGNVVARSGYWWCQVESGYYFFKGRKEP
ncbi:hypothetical protein L484_024705 [Morus notabilis]|uniref:Uncharacterized protein n=1 Tax=Morus notabilis TaxID=981085 RepID=W9RCY0_9ROSA|nr:hypothetical protein L484_024705 [Morus notabilis]